MRPAPWTARITGNIRAVNGDGERFNFLSATRSLRAASNSDASRDLRGQHAIVVAASKLATRAPDAISACAEWAMPGTVGALAHSPADGSSARTL